MRTPLDSKWPPGIQWGQLQLTGDVQPRLLRGTNTMRGDEGTPGTEIRMGGNEGVGVRMEGIQQRPGGARRDLLRKSEHGPAPSHTDVA